MSLPKTTAAVIRAATVLWIYLCLGLLRYGGLVLWDGPLGQLSPRVATDLAFNGGGFRFWSSRCGLGPWVDPLGHRRLDSYDDRLQVWATYCGLGCLRCVRPRRNWEILLCTTPTALVRCKLGLVADTNSAFFLIFWLPTHMSMKGCPRRTWEFSLCAATKDILYLPLVFILLLLFYIFITTSIRIQTLGHTI